MLEWVTAALGAVTAAALLGIVGWTAATQDPDELPRLTIEAERIVSHGEVHALEFTVRNAARRTARQVEVEGKVGGETGSASLDYVPARSDRTGALVFADDPRGKPIELRVTGYQLP